MNRGMFSSATDEWETPADLFRKLDERFHFDLDVSATPENAKCGRFFTKQDDGLSKNWGGVGLLDESSVWTADRQMGEESMGKREGWRDGGLPAARENGHGMVARLLHERRDHLHSRKIEIRRMHDERAVPFGNRSVQKGSQR